ncbi:MAG: hypothetical protein AB8G23_08405 [Myxococcota bacterium]
MRSPSNWTGFASYRDAFRPSLDDPTDAFAEEKILLDDFADFMADAEGPDSDSDSDFGNLGDLGDRGAFVSVGALGDGSRLEADPEFRERLRGRLWRTFVQTHLRDPVGRH